MGILINKQNILLSLTKSFSSQDTLFSITLFRDRVQVFHLKSSKTILSLHFTTITHSLQTTIKMMFSKIALTMTSFAALSAALPHAIKARNTTSTDSGSGGSGGVTIHNNLEGSVYAWSVSNGAGDMKTLSAGGGSYEESWRENSNGGGVSIKLSTEPNQDDVLQ